MPQRKRNKSTLILLATLLWLTPGCGTECGNPFCSSPSSQSSGLSPTQNDGLSNTPFGLIENLATETTNQLTYTDGADRFALNYPEDWLLETPSPDELTITSPGSANTSSFTLEVVSNDLNFETANAFAEAEFSALDWDDFVTSSTFGVIFEETQEIANGATVFKVIILKDPDVFIIDIVRNSANNGDNGINTIMNTFE